MSGYSVWVSGCSSSTSDGHLWRLYGKLGSQGSYLKLQDGGGDGSGSVVVVVVVVFDVVVVVVVVMVVLVVLLLM